MEKVTYKDTLKSADTEEWLDIWFNRPLGYAWARLFAWLGVIPNVVTILSIVLGVGAAVMFCYPDFWHNLAGVGLLVWANVYDSCDGQLARITNRRSLFGRLLDGFAGDAWFFCIYWAIVIRLWSVPLPGCDTATWGIWIFLLCLVSGLFFHARQCQLADYYRNMHLAHIPGGRSEMSTLRRERERFRAMDWRTDFWDKAAVFFYIGYLRSQERMTPCAQRLLAEIARQPGGRAPEAFRQAFRTGSLPMMKWANVLTFNCRALTLYTACLVGKPWIYPAAEILLFGALAWWLNRRHERMCADLTVRLMCGEFND